MGCECIYADYDFVDFYTEQVRRARKNHRCSECGSSIFPGEEYADVRHKNRGGPWERRKMCSTCRAIVDEFFCDGYGFDHVMADLDQYVMDRKGDIAEKCLVRLPPKAREIVCDMIERAWREWGEDGAFG
jgi:hypothetical protein